MVIYVELVKFAPKMAILISEVTTVGANSHADKMMYLMWSLVLLNAHAEIMITVVVTLLTYV